MSHKNTIKLHCLVFGFLTVTFHCICWLLSSSHFKQLSLMQFQLIEDIFLLVDEMHPIFFIQGLGHMMYHKAACVEILFFGSFSHESIMLHLLIHSANFCSQNN